MKVVVCVFVDVGHSQAPVCIDLDYNFCRVSGALVEACLAYPMNTFICPPTPQSLTDLDGSGSGRVFRPCTTFSSCLMIFGQLGFVACLEGLEARLAYPMNNFICLPTPQNLPDLDKSGTVRVCRCRTITNPSLH